MDLGTNVEVLNEGACRVAFRQAPLRFDLFSAGPLMNAVSDRKATKSLVVALPAARCRPTTAYRMVRFACARDFSLRDLELRRLAWRLTTHHRSGEPLGHS